MNNKLTNNFWPNLNISMGLIVIAAIFATAFFVARIEIKDLDLWLHLGAGKHMTEHQYVPLNDIFSNSVGGKHWNNHEWLFQVLLYNIYHLWGAAGLSHMQVVVVLLTLSVLFFIGYSRDRQLLSCFLLLLVYLVFQQRFTMRPDLFSLLFFSIYIYILSYHLDKKWSPYLLFGVQALWVNMHGFFIFGPLFVLVALISEWMKRHLKLPYEWNASGRLADPEYKRAMQVLAFVCFACVINPHFIKGALYPFGVLASISGDQSIFFDYILELRKPITQASFFATDFFVFYKLLLVLTVVSFVYNRRNIDLSVLFLWIIFLFFSLKAARNTTYFAFAAYLVLLSNFLSVSFGDIIPIRFTEKKFRHITEFFVKLCMLIWILNLNSTVQARNYYDFRNYEYKSELGGISLRSYPNRAIDFLVENNIKGNFFNDFNSGAYLIGRTYPNIRVYIDGRTELYGAKFFKEAYDDMWANGRKEVLDKNIEKYQLTGALLSSSRQQIPAKILKYFYDHPDWILVYFDFDGVIFLKDVPINRESIELHTLDLEAQNVPSFNIYKMGTLQAVPIEHINRAYTLESFGLYDLAEKEAQNALRISPMSEDAYKILGKIYAKRKNYSEAYLYFRRAAVLLPDNKKVRYNLGLALIDLKEYQEAVYMYQAILKKWPKEAKAAFFLAKAHALNHEFKPSMEALGKALAIDPGALRDAEKIGDIFYENKNYAEAAKVYEKVLTQNNKASQLYYKLAKSYKAFGQNNLAKRQIAVALQLEPKNTDFKKLLKSLN